jgi:hypothetical protein
MARRKAAPSPSTDISQAVPPPADAVEQPTAAAEPTSVDFPFGALAPVSTEPAVTETQAAAGEANPTKADDKPGSRPHIRSWSRDFVLGYQILTDERLKLIVLRFDERPADAVLAMVKDRGFKYRELREHGRVWVTPNDWEGRTLTDQLEQELYRYRTGQERAGQAVA